MTAEVSFKCLYCRYISKKYNAWRGHLLEESHQAQTRERIKTIDLKNKKKSIVVFGLTSVKKTDVLKYFGDLAVLTDFVFWKERPDFCIFTFLLRQFCDDILKNKHTINGHQLHLRSRADISDVEWFSICPFAAVNVKIEVDLGESTSPENPFSDSSSDEADNENNQNNENSDDASAKAAEAEMAMEEPAKEINSQEAISQDQDYLEMWDAMENEEAKSNWDDTNMIFDKDDVESTTSASTSATHREERMDRDNSLNGEAEVINSRNVNFDEGFVKDLNAQMEDLYDANLMPPAAWKVRCRVKDQIELMLKSVFPQCVLISFGAGSTAISSGREMLSMFVDVFGKTKHGPTTSLEEGAQMDITSQTRAEIKKKLLRILKDGRHNTVISEVKCKSDSKSISIEEDEIRFRYFDEREKVHIMCRVQTANFLAVQSCRLMGFLIKLDPRVRPLLIVTRQWAYDNYLVQSNPAQGMYKATSIHPVVIQWMTLYYLIKRKIIPPVPLLQKYALTPLTHFGVNLAFCDDREVLKWKSQDDYEKNPETGEPSARCILDLARKMFYYFGSIKLQNYVFITGRGSTVRRDCLNDDKNPLYDDYSWNCTKKLLTGNELCVQHPLKLFINLTSNVSSSVQKMFQKTCLDTATRLKNLTDDSSRICNILALLSIHKEIVWSIYQHQPLCSPTPSSSASASERQNDQLYNNVESMMEDSITEPDMFSRNKKRIKLKSFGHQLEIAKKFRLKAKQVIQPNLREALKVNIRAVWLKFLNDFNKTVWPLCFGIKITQMPNEIEDQKGMFGKPFGPYFKGVLLRPSKLSWVKRCARKCENNALKDPVFKSMFEQYSQALARSSNLSDDDLSSILENGVDQQLFSFRFRIFVKANKTTILSKAVAKTVIRFSDIHGSEINTELKKRLVILMFSELWNFYSNHRLMADEKDRLTVHDIDIPNVE